jgi:hypothetical protein
MHGRQRDFLLPIGRHRRLLWVWDFGRESSLPELTYREHSDVREQQSTWASDTQPWLVNLKRACPSAYSYPFDDATSTFQCQAQGSTNLLGYSIGFTDLPKPTSE